jgi:hypothetical protein
MLLRVCCEHCRLPTLWTDDPRSFLATACGDPARCRARVLDEQAIDVSPQYREAGLLQLFHGEWGAALGVKALSILALVNLTAAFVVLALGDAYMEARMRVGMYVLALPPFLAALLYAGSPRSLTASFTALLLAAGSVVLFGIDRVTSGVNASLLIVGSLAVALAVEVVRVALKGAVRLAAPSYRIALPVFLAIFLPFLSLGFPRALQLARSKDARLIERLSRRLKPEGGFLVIDRLSPRMAQEVRDRIVVRAAGRTYDLSGATLERIAKKRVRVAASQRGRESGSFGPRPAVGENVRLVLNMRRTTVPDEIELDGRRGETTTCRERVALRADAHP